MNNPELWNAPCLFLAFEAGIIQRREKLRRRTSEVLSDQIELMNGGCAYLGAEYTEQVKPGDLKGRKIDMVFLGRAFEEDWDETWEEVLRAHRRGPLCIVIKDIYKGRFNSLAWRQLRQEGTVSIDMMWYGIVFFDTRLQKGKYNVII